MKNNKFIKSLDRPLCIFDLETTGVDTTKDRIVEIAIIKVHPDGNMENKHAIINPLIPIPKEASDVHGFTDDLVKDKPTFKQLSKGILSFIYGCDLVTFNGNKFDIPFLNEEFSRSGLEWDWRSSRFIDASVIFRRFERRTLEAALLFYCGKELEGAHGAMNDTEATLSVLLSQIDKYDELPSDIDELHLFCNYDKPIADLGGCFEVDETGDIIFTFGKWKGHKAKDNKDYIRWMLSSDFSSDTKIICSQIINN